MSDNYDGPLMAQQILKLQAECAALNAEIGRLTELHTLYQDKTTQLKTERDALKADAERYRHLCERVPDPAWLNNCIDAAREVKP